MKKTINTRKRDTYHVGNLASLLLKAAREMLEAVGPSKLSIRAVSEEVGVSPTAAYHHFANRAELISCIAAQGFDELATALRQNPHEGSQQEKLRNASLAYFSFARKSPEVYQLMFGPELSQRDKSPSLQAASNEAFGELKRIIADYLQLDIESNDVYSAALSGWSLTHGLASLVIHEVIDFPEATSDENYVDRALQGFELLYGSRSA